MGNTCKSSKTDPTSPTIIEQPVPILSKQPFEAPDSSVISQMSQSIQDSIIREVDEEETSRTET